MPFGIDLGFSFGKKKASGTATDTRNETTTLSGTQTQAGVQSGVTNTSTSSSGTQQTSQSGVTTQDQTQSQSGTQKTTGTTTTLGTDVIDTLSGVVKQVLGAGVTDANIAALSNMIAGRTNFNADQFVDDQVTAARTRGEEQLQEQNSAFGNTIGGTANENSMAALLAARGRNDLEANIAGVRSSAEQAAQDIQNKNLGAAIEAQTGIAGIGQALTEAIKGGTTTTDMTQLTDQISNLLGKNTSAESGTTTEQQQSNQQVTQLLDTLQQLLTNQTSNTTGTETETSKTKSGGLGLSLGI